MRKYKLTEKGYLQDIWLSTKILSIILAFLDMVMIQTKYHFVGLDFKTILGGVQILVYIGTRNILRRLIFMDTKREKKKK